MPTPKIGRTILPIMIIQSVTSRNRSIRFEFPHIHQLLASYPNPAAATTVTLTILVVEPQQREQQIVGHPPLPPLARLISNHTPSLRTSPIWGMKKSPV